MQHYFVFFTVLMAKDSKRGDHFGIIILNAYIHGVIIPSSDGFILFISNTM